jgi:hypothetical protein
MGALVVVSVTWPAMLTAAPVGVGVSGALVVAGVWLLVVAGSVGTGIDSSMASTVVSWGGAAVQAMRHERVKSRNRATRRFKAGMQHSQILWHILRDKVAMSISYGKLLSYFSPKNKASLPLLTGTLVSIR